MVDTAARRRDNLIGSLWMVGVMAAFAVEDGFIKAATAEIPVAQVLILFGLGGALLFALDAVRVGERIFHPDVLSPPMRIRAVFEITGRLFYVLAIALTPLSSATVILQATPIVVVAAAALVFGERVGWRRWSAIALGLAGVLLIIRPGGESFSALSLLAVIGMLGFAGRDLASRAAPATLGTRTLGVYGFLAVAVAGALFSGWERAAFAWPDAPTSAALAVAVLAGVAAYACLMRAMRTGDVSAVTPFRYTRLLFGIAIGVVAFGERIGVYEWLGGALIVLSGLFLLWRGQRVQERTGRAGEGA